VLTDFDRYAEFIPDLRVSRAVARDGAKITVEQPEDAERRVPGACRCRTAMSHVRRRVMPLAQRGRAQM